MHHCGSIRRRMALLVSFANLLLFLVPAGHEASAGDLPAITLPQAVEAALRGNPELAGFVLDVRAAEGRALQASLRPNPEVEFEIANVGGDLPGTRRSESTVGVSQRIELGGKRPARVRKAEAETELVRRDLEGRTLDAVAWVRRGFVALLGAQRRLDLAREAHRIASLLSAAVGERVAAGAVSPIEETRARVALSVASADLARAERDVEEARRELAQAIGDPEPAFSSAAGELPEDTDVADLAGLQRNLARNPDLSRWELEIRAREAGVVAARTLSVPDMSLAGAYRRLAEDSENTFIAGFSVSLPLFDRNQGGVKEARSQASRAERERRAAEVRLVAELARRHAAMAAAAREVRTLRDEAIPGAKGAYDAVSEGYRLGKFRYLDVLDAGKALVEAKLRYADALISLNLAKVDVDRLVAEPAGTEAGLPAEK